MTVHTVASFVARYNGHFHCLGVGSSRLMDVIANDGLVTAVTSREESGELLSTTSHSHLMLFELFNKICILKKMIIE